LRRLDAARATVPPATRGFRTCSRVRLHQRTRCHRELLILGGSPRHRRVNRRPESVGIDSDSLSEFSKESHGRFAGGFRRENVSLTAAPINEGEHWRFVMLVRVSRGPASATLGRASGHSSRSRCRTRQSRPAQRGRLLARRALWQIARRAFEASDMKHRFLRLAGRY